jgi:hypothetical protein
MIINLLVFFLVKYRARNNRGGLCCAMQQEIRDYAEYIGLDLVTFPELSWIAEEGLHSPIPKDWVVVKNDQGHYFQHTVSGATQSDHPMDEHYRRVGEREMNRVNAEKKRDAEMSEERTRAAVEAQQQLLQKQQRRQQEQQREQDEVRRQQQQRLDEQLSGASYQQYSDGSPSRDAMMARVMAARREREDRGCELEPSQTTPARAERNIATSSAASDDLTPSQPRSEARRSRNNHPETQQQLHPQEHAIDKREPAKRTAAAGVVLRSGEADDSVSSVTKARPAATTHRKLRFWAYLMLGCLLLHSVVSNTVLNSQLMSTPAVSESADALAALLRQSTQSRIFIVKPQPREAATEASSDPLAPNATAAVPADQQQQPTGSKPNTKAVEPESADEDEEEGWLW